MEHILSLNQGTFWVGENKQFVRYIANMPQDQIPKPAIKINIQPFLVRDDDGYILLDTGLSAWNEEQGTPDILHLIRTHHLDIADIHTILISHLHQDHFSGLFHPHTGELLFPQAKIYIYKPDWEHCITHHRYPLYETHLEHLAKHPYIHWMEQSQGNITPHIRYMHTGGHMPFHVVFWIEQNGKTIFYGGDEAPQLAQMKMNLVAKYDFDGKKANDLRKEWFKEGEENKWTFLFYHEVQDPIFNFSS